MEAITLHSRVASDGSLQLQLPDELKGHEVTVTIKRSMQTLDVSLGVNLGWPEGFFAETAGALADDESFFRHPQGDYEPRKFIWNYRIATGIARTDRCVHELSHSDPQE
ncbi:MAG: hypothetical protein WCD18_11750 [Thermosynechococcaceae cyanobacterium]